MHCLGAVLVATILVALPAAGQDAILKGSDLFATGATGTTFVSFATDPIPAGFFCKGSPAFYGQIRLQGVPLTTSPAGIAGETDTIVRRLADAPFDSYGHARAPVRIVALKLEAMDPIVVQCSSGLRAFDLSVCLPRGVTQPVTYIDIYKTFDDGGIFKGQLVVYADLVFIDQATGNVLDPIQQTIDMKVLDSNRWMRYPGPGGVHVTSWFGVDADCDGQAELGVPPTTNFYPGWNPSMPDCYSKTIYDEGCHENPGGDHAHCVGTPCSRN
jgi:hypothetical protein